MATGINTLKKWFSSGLKPKQEQFWAWIDSYFHKNEKIPQSNIEGLDKSLENKAETNHTHSYNDLTDKPNLFSGDYNDLINKPNIQATIPTFSQIIDGGSTYLKSPISFILKENAGAEEGDSTGQIGVKNKNYFFGNFNFNLAGENNVSIGLNNAQNREISGKSVFVGSNNAQNLPAVYRLVVVGSDIGQNLNARVSVGDLKSVNPAIGDYLTEQYKDYFNIDTETETMPSGFSTLIGNEILNTNVTRIFGSIHIGDHSLGGHQWRSFNNIIIGNFLWGGASNMRFNNSIVIGNHINTWSSDGCLAIHNGRDRRVNISDSLIYGKFEERELKINGRFSFSTQYTPTQEHFTGQKLVVVDNLGQTSLIDPAGLISTPTNPVQWVTINNNEFSFVEGKSVYYPEQILDNAEATKKELKKIVGGKAGDTIHIRATRNLKIIHDGDYIRLFENKSITEGLDGNKVITMLCLAPNKWTEINRSWGYGQGAITADFSSLTIGGVNLHKDTKVPNFTANDVGTGAKSVMTDATGIFARYTPANGKNVSLYGFRTEGSANGGFSRSVDVRHSHTSNITIWGKSIPPNQWFRLKDENFKSLNDWTLINVDTPNVSIDLRNFKVENGIKATDWNLHPEEAPNPFATTGLTESPLFGHILMINANTKEYAYKSLLKIIEQMDIPTLQLLKQRLSSV